MPPAVLLPAGLQQEELPGATDGVARPREQGPGELLVTRRHGTAVDQHRHGGEPHGGAGTRGTRREGTGSA